MTVPATRDGTFHMPSGRGAVPFKVAVEDEDVGLAPAKSQHQLVRVQKDFPQSTALRVSKCLSIQNLSAHFLSIARCLSTDRFSPFTGSGRSVRLAYSSDVQYFWYYIPFFLLCLSG